MGRKNGGPKAPQAPLRDRFGRFATRKKKPKPGPYVSPDDMSGILDRFERDGFIQVKFGMAGVYTIANRRLESSRGMIHIPISLWWKGARNSDNVSPIVHNSLHAYHLPNSDDWGQALQLNLTGNFFESYGSGSTPRACAAAFLNMLLSGVPIHMTGCGVTTSDAAHHRNVFVNGSEKKIEVLPAKD